MTPQDFRQSIIEPGAAWLHGITGQTSSGAAQRILLAIAIQESRLRDRAQVLSSGQPRPARGFWQFERGGGVTGVLTHGVSRRAAQACCQAACVRDEVEACWQAIEGHDPLAYSFARLLLRTDPYAVPTTEGDAWACYTRVWRPGKPHRERWSSSWADSSISFNSFI